MKSDGTKKRQRIATVVVVLVVIAMVITTEIGRASCRERV